MKRHKNLERAVVLSLLMSSSIYGTVFAENIGFIENEDVDESYNEDVIIDASNNKDKSAIFLSKEGKDVIITTSSNEINIGNITLQSKKYGIRTENKNDVRLNSAKNNIIKVNGTASDDSGDGINVTANSTGVIELRADKGNNEIQVVDDGIYVDTGSSKEVTLTAGSTDESGNIITNGDNIITAGNNGIDYRGSDDGDSKTAKLEVTATGANIIKAGVSEVLGNAVGKDENKDGIFGNNGYREDKNGDGIRIQGNGNVEVTAGTYNDIAVRDTGLYIHGDSTNSKIDLIANGTKGTFGNIIYAQENGVQIDGKNEGNAINVIANNGGNSITAKENAVYNNGSGTIKISAKKPDMKVSTLANYNDYNNELTAEENGVKSDGTGSTIVEADNNNIVAGTVNGILSNAAGTINVTAGNNNTIGQYTDENKKVHTSEMGIKTYNGKVSVTATEDNTIYGTKYGIRAEEGNSDITTEAKNGNNTINVYGFYDNDKLDTTFGDGINVTADSTGTIELKADKGNNEINAIDDGIYVDTGSTKKVTLTAGSTDNNITTIGNNEITAGNNGIDYRGSGDNDSTTVDLEVTATGANIITAGVSEVLGNTVGKDENKDGIFGNNGYREDKNGDGIRTENSTGTVKVEAGTYNQIDVRDTGLYIKGNGEASGDGSQIDLIANGIKENTIYGNIISAQENGVQIDGINSEIDVKSVSAGNRIEVKNIAVYNTGNNSTINIEANSSNMLIAGNVSTVNNQDYADGHAIQAENNSIVNLNTTSGDNIVLGVIYAKDAGTEVNLKHDLPIKAMNEAGAGSTSTGTGSNIIKSNAHGSVDEAGNREKVVAALYAQGNAEINVIAGNGENDYNYIGTSYTDLDDPENSTGSERTVWAQRGGKINIEGTTTIKSSNAENFYEAGYATNSRGVAITAGSDKVDFDNAGNLADVENHSQVTLNYGVGSNISGDIVAGYGGIIDINREENNLTRANENNGLHMQGNILAANGGVLNIDLGDGGTLYGRADDYGDAGYGETAKDNQNFYNPVFSSDIYTGGTVNINMGEGSKWCLTGQSWVSSLDVSKGNGNVTIDMAKFNEGTHGLTISELKGTQDGKVDATFVMDLDHNAHNTSDMLYIKNGTGEYDVVLNDVIDGMENINENNVLRFATVQGGASFNSVTMEEQGMYNLGFEIDHSEYDTTDGENKDYNGTSVDTNKPGNDNVEGFFGLENEEENTSKIMLLDEVDSATDTSIQNWYITKVLGQGLSDAGKTVLNMSRANYSQAVYMDTLNKRLGEARYLEGDEGLWIRMRHDKIDKDSSYEITNNMYELGYDKKYESKDKNGYHRKGVAIDYMDGDTSYDDIAGSGETNRKGIWLYDTWIGNKGHYTDYVAKWGHLENSFDLYTKTAGEKVSGEYDNDVYSLSAEWGYKDQLNNDWYIEPQVQLQYARVTGADYETSQGTQVSVDGIDSLIARAGFRLGKDFGEEKKSTFYVKADVLHEFLGDQDITAIDKTTNGAASIGYDNDGTWYSVGLGFSTMLSDNSYAFIDVEKLFGNDNDNSYQINGGFNWLL